MPRKHPTKKCPDCKNPVSYGYPTPKYCIHCAGNHKRKDPVNIFFKSTEKTPTCWLWMKALNGQGYGVLNGPIRLAHRLSWTIHKYPIPKGKFVLHKCDNPRCVNPAHLFLGTQTDNMKDMISKDRDKKSFGENHCCAKLTGKTVKKIRSLYKSDNLTSRELGSRFGVHHHAILDVVHRKTWAHVH